MVVSGSARALALVLVAVACDRDPPARRPAHAESARVEPTPETVPPPSAPRRLQVGDPAADAYRAVVRAYNQRDREVYFGGFADQLTCFYGRAEVPLDELRERRLRDGERGVLAVASLKILHRAPDRVALLDRGFFSEDPGSARQVLHEKIIVLERRDGAWRIVAETSAAERGCLAGLVPATVTASEGFDGCRNAHRSCMSGCPCEGGADECAACRLSCERGAMQCLGLDRPADRETAPVAPIGLGSVDDVRRFVELALKEAYNDWSGGPTDEGMSADDVRWLAAVELALGAPRWRRSNDETEATSCGWSILGTEAPEDPRVEEVRCTPALDRCVAYVRMNDWREGLSELHLLFDGGHLRATHLSTPDPARAVDPAALDRFATARPRDWNTPCQPALEALLGDRVGDDLFVVATPMADEENLYAIRRLCGAAVQREVHGLGDRWECEERRCAPPYMCGNYCEDLTVDRAGRVISVSQDIDAEALTEEQATSFRAQIACGATMRVEDLP